MDATDPRSDDTFNTAESSRSNWATFSYWLFQVLSIEDEPGFNDLKVRGMYRGWRNLLTYGWFESGAILHGGGCFLQPNPARRT